MEHKTCKDCKWNEYPLCKGTIMPDGEFMSIENMRPNFKCGQKLGLIFSILINSPSGIIVPLHNGYSFHLQSLHVLEEKL